MIADSLSGLPSSRFRAVIINHNTRLVTTLALLSALRYAGMPVLLIECESTDGSIEHFRGLAADLPFDLICVPLQKHGLTLDWIFKSVPAEFVLAIDSDIEILNAALVDFCKENIEFPDVFGCGFVNGPLILGGPGFAGRRLDGALYVERPWMPIAMFNVAFVREALAAGVSFGDRFVNNEFARLSAVPILPGVLRKIFRTGPGILRRAYHADFRPGAVYYDTGAMIYQHLKFVQHLSFAGLPLAAQGRYVSHFFGTTRNVIAPGSLNGADVPDIQAEVLRSLRMKYGFEV